MRRVHTQIDIEAPVQKVWDLITDLDNYAAWNPFVVMGRGPIREGEKITVRAEPEGAPGKTFRPVITKLAPGRELRWLGHFLLPGLVDGEHIHILESLGETRGLGPRLDSGAVANGAQEDFSQNERTTLTRWWTHSGQPLSRAPLLPLAQGFRWFMNRQGAR